MISYRDRILKAIGESEVGLTTVDVAKRSGVSKTTVIKYLSVLRSEGRVEFVEVGPSKLWRTSNPSAKVEKSHEPQRREALPVVDMDLCDGEEKTVYFSFRVRPEEICELMKRANKCLSVSETLR
jgi:DNA-binding IclR family transcriptional regulator